MSHFLSANDPYLAQFYNELQIALSVYKDLKTNTVRSEQLLNFELLLVQLYKSATQSVINYENWTSGLSKLSDFRYTQYTLLDVKQQIFSATNGDTPEEAFPKKSDLFYGYYVQVMGLFNANRRYESEVRI